MNAQGPAMRGFNLQPSWHKRIHSVGQPARLSLMKKLADLVADGME